MGHVYHGKTTSIHYVAGHINEIPIPACGTFINGAAVRHTINVDLVSCPRCRRTLIACGVEIEQKYWPPHVNTEGDVQVYALPKFAHTGLHE